MSEYQLQIKQVVDYPRCRIYRQFVQSLITDQGIRTGGGSGLFYFTVLCSYARTTVGRVLKKFERLGHISLMAFLGTKGSVIYLQNYLSTMFQISDVLIDKEEVAMSLNIKISLPDKDRGCCP